jgi:hypothetical protein
MTKNNDVILNEEPWGVEPAVSDETNQNEQKLPRGYEERAHKRWFVDYFAEKREMTLGKGEGGGWGEWSHYRWVRCPYETSEDVLEIIRHAFFPSTQGWNSPEASDGSQTLYQERAAAGTIRIQRSDWLDEDVGEDELQLAKHGVECVEEILELGKTKGLKFTRRARDYQDRYQAGHDVLHRNLDEDPEGIYSFGYEKTIVMPCSVRITAGNPEEAARKLLDGEYTHANCDIARRYSVFSDETYPEDPDELFQHEDGEVFSPDDSREEKLAAIADLLEAA